MPARSLVLKCLLDGEAYGGRRRAPRIPCAGPPTAAASSGRGRGRWRFRPGIHVVESQLSLSLDAAPATRRRRPLGPNAAPLRPLLDREPVAAQDGSGQRGIAVLTLAFAPVTRAIPVSGWGPQRRPHFAHPQCAAREPREQRLSVHAHEYVIRSLRVRGLMGDRDKTGAPSKCIRAPGRRMARRYTDHPPHPRHVRLGGGTLFSGGGQPRRREPSAETSEMTSTHSRGPRQRAREI